MYCIPKLESDIVLICSVVEHIIHESVSYYRMSDGSCWLLFMPVGKCVEFNGKTPIRSGIGRSTLALLLMVLGHCDFSAHTNILAVLAVPFIQSCHHLKVMQTKLN